MKKLLNILFILLITITVLPSQIVEAETYNETETFYGVKYASYCTGNDCSYKPNSSLVSSGSVSSSYKDGFYRLAYI